MSKNTALTRLDCYSDTLKSIAISEECIGKLQLKMTFASDCSWTYQNIDGEIVAENVNDLYTLSELPLIATNEAGTKSIQIVTTPTLAGYHMGDVLKLQTFFEQTDSSGTKNGAKFRTEYNVNDPTTWEFVSWSEVDGLKRLSHIDWRHERYNFVGDLDLSDCVALGELNFHGTQINSLNVSGCTTLTKVQCGSNQLTSLNVSNNTQLTTIQCDNNQLTSLDVSSCTQLDSLYCYSNKLTFIDVSKNSQLYTLDCYSDTLKEIVVPNGRNENFRLQLGSGSGGIWTFRNLEGETLGTCRQGYPYTLTELPLIVSNSAGTHNVQVLSSPKLFGYDIRDVYAIQSFLAQRDVEEVKNAHRLNPAYRTNDPTTWGDGITWTEIDGMKRITAIDWSNCGLMGDLDLSACTALTELNCANNNLSSLTVLENATLIKLDCNNCQLTTLDVSNTTNLAELICWGNQFSTLDVSKNSNLTNLVAYSDALTNVVISPDNVNKTQINLYHGSNSAWTYKTLTGETLEETTAMASSSYLLGTLPIVAENTAGKMITFATQLSVPTHNTPTSFGTTVSVSWEAVENASGYTVEYKLTNATEWTVITDVMETSTTFNGEVGKTYQLRVKANGGEKYADSNYSVTHSVSVTAPYNENDFTKIRNFLEQTNAQGVKNGTTMNANYNADDPTTWSGVNWSENNDEKRVVYIHWRERGLAGDLDLTNCTMLECLECEHNQLTSLNVAGLEKLRELRSARNQITSLNVTGCVQLYSFGCNMNPLTSLDVTSCTALEELWCYSSQLTALDLSRNTQLQYLNCHSNPLTSLDVTSCTALEELWCYSSQLTALDLSRNTQLQYLNCHSNPLTSLNLLGNANLTELHCYSENLENIILSETSVGKVKINLYTGSNSAWTFTNSAGETASTSSSYTLSTLPTTATNAAGTKSIMVYALSSIETMVGYNAEELAAILNFLEQTDENNVKNGTKINSAYDGFNPITWLGITWTEIDGEKHVTEINWSAKQLVGDLNLSGCSALVKLSCSDNQLTSLNVSDNTALTELRCYSDTLKNIIISEECVGKTKIYLYDGSNSAWTFKNLTGQTVGTTTASTSSAYTLTEMPVIATNNAGKTIYLFASSALVNYDLNQIQKLQNFLEQTDANGVKNGTKINSNYDSNNPNTWSITWTTVDGLKSAKEIRWASKTLSGKLDLSDFTELESLYCTSNQLTELNVSNCTALAYLSCYSNQLTELDVSNCTALTDLNCYSNQLTVLDVSNCTALTWGSCYSDTLEYVVMPETCIGKAQISLYSGSNSAWTFKNAKDETLSVMTGNSYYKFTELPVTATNAAGTKTIPFITSPTLVGYHYGDVKALQSFLEQTDENGVKNGTKLNSTYNVNDPTTWNNTVVWMDVNGFKRVNKINWSNYGFTGTLNLSALTELKTLNCNSNQLTALNISGCNSLTDLICQENEFTTLDLSNCSSLINVRCYSDMLEKVAISSQCLGKMKFYLYSGSNCAWTFQNLAGETIGSAAADANASYAFTTFPAKATNDAGKTITFSTELATPTIYTLSISGTTVSVNWTAVENATSYTLEYKRRNATEWTTVTGLTETNVTFNGTADVIYEIRVRAESDVHIDSSYSNEETFITVSEYNSDEYHQIIKFLEQTDENGVKNGQKIDANYDITDVNTWGNVTWSDIDGTMRITRISWISKNLVGNLDLSACSMLTTLVCNSNKLTGLNLTGCSALTSLTCYGNQLAELDVSTCTALSSMNCDYNLLTALDVSNCGALTSLACNSNQLTSMTFDGCDALQSIYCYYNQFTILDVSKCTKLSNLSCYSSTLKSIIVPEESLRKLNINLNTSGTWTLTNCDGKKLKNPYTELPALATNTSGRMITIVTSETLAEYHISDVVKLQEFLERTDASGVKNGQKLNAAYNVNDVATWTGVTWTETNNVKRVQKITWANKGLVGDLDLSYCPMLTELSCQGNQLSLLNVSGCIRLVNLWCYSDTLKKVALSTENIGKTRIYLYDGSNCAWTFKNLAGNTVGNTVANASSNYVLTELPINATNETGEKILFTTELATPTIETLTISGETVSASWSEVENATSYTLEYRLEGTSTWNAITGITETSASFNGKADEVYDVRIIAEADDYFHSKCSDSSSIMLVTKYNQNEYNQLRAFFEQTDENGKKNGEKLNSSYSATNLNTWTWRITWTLIDDVYRATAIEIKDIDIVGDLNLSGFSALQTLNCYYTKLTTLNLSGCSAITSLDCSVNNLTSLDISGCSAITTLNCCVNELTSLDISDCPTLTSFEVQANHLTSIDVSSCTNLKLFYCFSNELEALDVSNNTALTSLYCNSNHLTTLDLSKNTALKTLYCETNSFTSLDISKNIALSSMRCYSETLDEIVVSSKSIGKLKLDLITFSNSTWTLTNSNGENIGTLTSGNPISQLPLTATNADGTHSIAIVFPQLDAPTVSRTTISGKAVAVSWNAVENATSYTLEYRVSGASDWTAITGLTGTSTTFNGVSGSTYEIRVKAFAENYTDSEYSLTKSIAISSSYNQHDCDKLLNFLEQTNENGVKNGTRINSAYNIDDPTTWSGVIWKEVDGTKYAKEINWESKGLIGELDLSGCTELTTVLCRFNSLTTLNVSGCTALTLLYRTHNQLTSLNISGCTGLTELNRTNNPITSLNASGCTGLTTINYQDSQLTLLDVSGCTALVTLNCQNNQLTSLDVSGCTALTTLECNDNQLTSLDVSKNIALTQLLCYSNTLENVILSSNSIGKIELNMFPASNSAWTFKNSSGNIVGSTEANSSSYYLLSELPITATNAVGTKSILFTMLPAGYNINDVTKLQNFLEQTDADGVKNGTKLNSAYDANAPTTWTGVIWKEIDGEKRLFQTSTAWFNKNFVGNLDLSGCTYLEHLSVWDNQISGINVTGCTALRVLWCDDNQITELDVSTNTELGVMHVGGNLYTKLDLSNNTKLTELWCELTNLTSLDISNCKDLRLLRCYSETLKYVVVPEKKGNFQLDLAYESNTSWTLKNAAEESNPTEFPITATNAEGTQTIQFITSPTLAGYNIGDVAKLQNFLEQTDENGEKNGTKINSAYNVDDPTSWTGVSWQKINHEYRITSVYWHYIGLVGDLNLSGCSELTSLSCVSSRITALNLSGCTALKMLSCNSNNSLTSLDVSQNTALTSLHCGGYGLTSLDVSKNTALKELSCSYTELTTLDVSKNKNLTKLSCSSNSKLASINVSGCTALQQLYSQYNGLKSLDVSGCTSLTELSSISNTSLKSLNASGCIALTKLKCESNRALTSLDVSNCTALKTFICYDNTVLKSLDVSTCTALTGFECYSNKSLTSLDVSGCIALQSLRCYSNISLTSLDVSKCTALTSMFCFSNNSLTSLNVSGCVALTSLQCYSNSSLTSLDVSKNTKLYVLVCHSNQFSSLDVSQNTNLTVLYCVLDQVLISENSIGKTKIYLYRGSNTAWTFTNSAGEIVGNTTASDISYYLLTELPVTATNEEGTKSILFTTSLVESLSVPTMKTPTVEGTTVSVSWKEVENAVSYTLEYRIAGETTWGEMADLTSTFMAIDCEAGNTYEFRVKANGEGNYSDSDYSEIRSILVDPKFDLVIENGGTVPTALNHGDLFSLTTGKITNRGEITSDAYTVQFYASTDTIFDASDILLGTKSLGILNAGATTTATLSRIDSSKLTAGKTYYFGWKIVSEADANQTNNAMFHTQVVTVTEVVLPEWGTVSLNSDATSKETFTLAINVLPDEMFVDDGLSVMISYSTDEIECVNLGNATGGQVKENKDKNQITCNWFTPQSELLPGLEFRFKEGVETATITVKVLDSGAEYCSKQVLEVQKPRVTFDIDENGKFVLKDVILLQRYLVGYDETDITDGLNLSADPEKIFTDIRDNLEIFDVDGNGKFVLKDVILLQRYLVGYDETDITDGLNISTDPATIINYIEAYLPNSGTNATSATGAILATGAVNQVSDAEEGLISLAPLSAHLSVPLSTAFETEWGEITLATTPTGANHFSLEIGTHPKEMFVDDGLSVVINYNADEIECVNLGDTAGGQGKVNNAGNRITCNWFTPQSELLPGLEFQFRDGVENATITVTVKDSGEDYFSTEEIVVSNVPLNLSTPEINSVTVSENTVSVSWTEVENATNYTLEYRISGTSDWIAMTELAETSTNFEGKAGNTYEIRMKAVGTGNYLDSDYSSILAVNVPYFDLKMSCVENTGNEENAEDGSVMPEKIIFGETFSLTSGTITNIGTGISNPYTVLFYASTDENITYNDIILGSVNMESLPVNQTATATLENISTVTLQSDTPYYFGWKIVSVDDFNPNNNVGHAPTTLTMSPKALATPILDENVTISGNRITVMWNHIPNAVSYTLEYRVLGDSIDSNNSEWSVISDLRSASATISGVVNTTYEFRVKADGAGNYSDSEYSTTVTARILPQYDLTVANGGLIPENIVYGNTFSLTTGKITNVGPNESKAYTVQFYASTDRNITTTDILLGSQKMAPLAANAETTVTKTEIDNTKLSLGETYYFGWMIVSADDANVTNNTGFNSTPISIERKIGVVTDIIVQAQSASSMKINWSAYENATGMESETAVSYTVERSNSSNGGWKAIQTCSASTLGAFSVLDANCKANKMYYYRVSAYNTEGKLLAISSGKDSATTWLESPTQFLAETVSTTEIDLTWKNVSGATQYTLMRSENNTDWVTIATVGKGTKTWRDSDLAPATTYNYRIFAESTTDKGKNISATVSTTGVTNKLTEENVAENYVVIFSGGGSQTSNHSRYYETTREFYEICTGIYGIPEENIYILYADGSNSSTDRSDGQDSDLSYASGSYIDVALQSNFEYVMATLGGLMDNNDHLVVYTFDHGNGETKNPNLTNEEYIVGWQTDSYKEICAKYLAMDAQVRSLYAEYQAGRLSKEEIYQLQALLDEYYATYDILFQYENDMIITGSEFANAMFDIQEGYVTMVLNQCFSGGILDNIFNPETGEVWSKDPDTGEKRNITNIDFDKWAGLAASNHYESSFDNAFPAAFNEALYTYTDTQMLFEYAKRNDVYAANKEDYDNNEGIFTTVQIEGEIYQCTEHPWFIGNSFSIFATQNGQDVYNANVKPETPKKIRVNRYNSTEKTAILSWLDNSSNESFFEIQYSTDNGETWQTFQTVEANTKTVTLSNVEFGTNYQYRIRACNEAGNSDWMVMESNFTPSAAPSTPTNITFGEYDLATNSMWISWTDTSDDENGFIVQYRKKLATVDTLSSTSGVTAENVTSENTVSEWITAGSVVANETSLLVNGIDDSGNWEFRVIAFHDNGNSADSGQHTETASFSFSAPDPVTDLTFGVYEPDEKTLQISWSDNSTNEDIFRLEYSADGGQTWTLVAQLDRDVTQAIFQNVQEGISYAFRVRAENAYGNSSWTTTETDFSTALIPATPENVTFSDYSAEARSVKMSWESVVVNNVSVSGFNVEWSLNGITWTRMNDINVATETQNHSVTYGATLEGTTYHYRVRAFNEFGASEWKEASFRTHITLDSATLSSSAPIQDLEIAVSPIPTVADATYQWYRITTTDNVVAITRIDGATSRVYIPTEEDLGAYLKCEITGTGTPTETGDTYVGTVSVQTTDTVIQLPGIFHTRLVTSQKNALGSHKMSGNDATSVNEWGFALEIWSEKFKQRTFSISYNSNLYTLDTDACKTMTGFNLTFGESVTMNGVTTVNVTLNSLAKSTQITENTLLALLKFKAQS
ncbi:MAG: fibronectin type III domain-containing protein, partial [Planctomycetia bacterium]|nr:fibronectin type III domain-containing protein [Planctomycetia bacterium]